jgi:hypothetical protein
MTYQIVLLSALPLKIKTAMLEAPLLARQALRAAKRPVRFNYAFRAASTYSASAIEAMNPHGVEISKAQRVAQNGLVSGS